MSLVRPLAFFGSHELYIKDGTKSPEHTFDSDNTNNNHESTYTSESYSSNSYGGAKYLLDSPSDTSENPFLTLDYDEDKVRLKLQELEKVLLNDDGDSSCMETDPINDSPKESSSSFDSNSNFIIAKEITNLPPKALLFECANSIHNGNLVDATRMIDALRQRVSILGEPTDRIAAYMVEALAARIGSSGSGLYRSLRCKEAPSNDRLSAMQVLFEICPCFRFGFMAANGAIVEAARNEPRVHIIDFDINQGSQYYTLLQTLAKNPGTKRAHVRLTGLDDPETVQRPVGGLKVIGLRLEQLAKDLGLSFEFKAVASRTVLVSPQTLNCRQPGEEALIVNFAFQLHHMPDESVSTVNLRDRLLRMVKGLNPKLVTVVEQDVNTNTSPFLTRFAEAYSYYSAVFESLDATLARESQDRMNVEKHCLARDIVNVVACEGEERIERYEVAGKWRARMSMAGFRACPVSRDVKDEIRELIKMYSDRFKVKEEMGGLHFGWEDKILIVSSAWR
ncbi:Scarecrow-like protein 1 [Striga hermonthica]|uniref:Scarecrow-like protein 1 n=1 Tax=Striga hermonthica TaxID=68872 RepID=A0A9N7NIU4_STRHE|nr:Scarecrow-like protein 1 [Striga hermonthica]